MELTVHHFSLERHFFSGAGRYQDIKGDECRYHSDSDLRVDRKINIIKYDEPNQASLEEYKDI